MGPFDQDCRDGGFASRVNPSCSSSSASAAVSRAGQTGIGRVVVPEIFRRDSMQSEGSNGLAGSRRGSKIEVGAACSSPAVLGESAASAPMNYSGVASPALTVSSAPLPDRGYDRSLDLDDASIQWTAFDVKPGRSGDSRRSSILNPSEVGVHASTSMISEDSRSDFPLRNASLISASGLDEDPSMGLDFSSLRLSSSASELSLLPKLFQPGPLGLTIELNGKVTSVTPNSQGFRAGIQVNWVFKALNGFPFSRELLQVLIKGNKPYQAMFIPSRLAQQIQMRGRSGSTSTVPSPVLPRDISRASSNGGGSMVNVGSILSGGTGNNWEGDTMQCAICDSRFNLRLRRHHCRICGRCVCWNCSPHQVKLDGPCQDEGLSRACRTCIDLEGAGRNTELTMALVAATARLREMRKDGGDNSSCSAAPPTSIGQAVAMVQEAVVGMEEVERQRGSRLEKAEALAAERSAEAAAIAELMAKSVDQNHWASGKLVEAVERLGHICPPVATPGEASSSGANACTTFEQKTLIQAVNDFDEAIRQLKIRLEARGSGASKRQAIEAGAWEADGSRCSLCERRVGKRYLNPRHHCRKCGRCVCGPCSPNVVQLEADVGPQRLCTACVDAAFAGTKFSKSTTTNEAETDSPLPP
mmetsp:Transcript_44386/g.95670  ORF Transcript_44386/g.95670 Transcript_44386/m.95670 type:complete len:643 (-) Transcript_44386:182-2110(-)